MGVVPVEVQLAKDAAKAGRDGVTYVLRLPGYRERLLVADVATDRTFHVSLEKAARAAARQEAATRRGGHRPQSGPEPRRRRRAGDAVVLEARSRRAGRQAFVVDAPALLRAATACPGSARAPARRGCGSRGSGGAPARRCRRRPRCRPRARRCRRRRSPGTIAAPPRPSSANAITARMPICPKRSRRISLRSMLKVTDVSVPLAFGDDDGLDVRHQRKRVALGEVERPDQPGPDPLGALPLDAIAVMPADRHQLLAQKAIDGAPHDVLRRLDDAADDHAARAQRARQRPAAPPSSMGTPRCSSSSAWSTASRRSPASSPSRSSSTTRQRLVAGRAPPAVGLCVSISAARRRTKSTSLARQLVGRHDTLEYSAASGRITGRLSRCLRIGKPIRMTSSYIQSGQYARSRPRGDRGRPNQPAQPRIGAPWRRVR